MSLARPFPRPLTVRYLIFFCFFCLFFLPVPDLTVAHNKAAHQHARAPSLSNATPSKRNKKNDGHCCGHLFLWGICLWVSATWCFVFFFRSFCRVGFFFWPGPTRPRPSTEGEINKVFVVFVDGSPSIFLRRSARKFATGGPLVSSCHSTVTVAFISLCFFFVCWFCCCCCCCWSSLLDFCFSRPHCKTLWGVLEVGRSQSDACLLLPFGVPTG